tara:strand:- start:293 stop:457 length:165 start_codon:yes stop_codon:yes gene_type:complete
MAGIAIGDQTRSRSVVVHDPMKAWPQAERARQHDGGEQPGDAAEECERESGVFL